MSPGNNNKLKVAVLGGAINSAIGHVHYSAINMDNLYELVAGCFSRNNELNHLTAKQYGVNAKHVHNNLSELLGKEKDNINAVILLTPIDQHAQQVLSCINSGIPVVCEKALACNSSEANEIRFALEKYNGFLAVISNYLGYPMIRELKYIIENGRIGKVHCIQIEMPQEGFIRVTANDEPIVPQKWRLHDGIIPTISLDLGVHLHMIVKYLSGEIPVSVVSTSESLGNFHEVIDNVSSIVEYSNNLTCNIWYSKIAIGNRNGLKLRVYGETGSAEWIQEKPEYLHLADRRGNRWTLDRGSSEVNISNQIRYTRFKAGHPAGFIEAFANYYFDVADALEHYWDHEPHYINANCFGIKEALEGLQLLEAIAKSSSTKKWERIILTN